MGTFGEYLKKRRLTMATDEFAPFKRVTPFVQSDIAPVKTSSEAQKNSYFQKGALEDGKVGKAIGATGLDAVGDAGKETLGFWESLWDGFVQFAARWNHAQTMSGTAGANPDTAPQITGAGKAVKDLLYSGIAEQEEARATRSIEEVDKYVKKDIIKEEEIVDNFLAPIKEKTGINIEADSVLGAKSDAAVRSLTNLGIRMGLTKAASAIPYVGPVLGPLVGYGTTYFGTLGAENETALRANASSEDAFASAAISAIVETVTSGLAGMSFGGKTLLPDFGKYVAQYIGNDKIAKVVKLLIDALGEVGEGEISYAGQQFGRWLTWQNDKDLKEMFTKEEAWDNAITAFVITLLLKGGSVVKANIQGDYVTGKNVNKPPEMVQGLGENVANQEKHGTIWKTEFDKLLEKDAVEASEQLNVKGDDTSSILGEGGSNTVNPNDIRFSQSSVNGSAEIVESMRNNGWVGDPIDVVRMPDGGLTTIDNTRVAAARQAGIDVQANIHAYDDLLPVEYIDRFTTKKGVPTTWGDAITLRIGKQNATFRDSNPYGSIDMDNIK